MTGADEPEADFIAHEWIVDEAARLKWIEYQCAQMRAEGVTYCRVGHPKDYPQDLWVEGWKARPDEMPCMPWEAGI